jgi:hypothetical protein
LEDAIPQLAIQLQLNYILSATDESSEPDSSSNDSSESDGDSDRENEADDEESFQVAGYAVVESLCERREDVLNARYVMERSAWRGLRAIRGDNLEYFFTMDENWFRAQVRLSISRRYGTMLAYVSDIHIPSFGWIVTIGGLSRASN